MGAWSRSPACPPICTWFSSSCWRTAWEPLWSIMERGPSTFHLCVFIFIQQVFGFFHFLNSARKWVFLLSSVGRLGSIICFSQIKKCSILFFFYSILRRWTLSSVSKNYFTFRAGSGSALHWVRTVLVRNRSFQFYASTSVTTWSWLLKTSTTCFAYRGCGEYEAGGPGWGDSASWATRGGQVLPHQRQAQHNELVSR